MYDALTIAAFVDEMNDTLVNGRIQQAVQVDALTLALEVYALRQRRWLTMSAHPTEARVLLSEQRVSGDPERVSPILLLLRKYARGGRIVAVSQPRYERILRVSIAKPLDMDNDGEPDLTSVDLYVELMGRRSNIILADQSGRILDAVKRVTPEMSRARPIRPGAQYVPPPPQNRADPAAVNAATLLAAARDSDEPLARWLVGAFVAVSPRLAREAAARAGIDADAPAGGLDRDAAERLARALAQLFEPMSSGRWSPVAYLGPDGGEFSPIPLTLYEGRDDIEARPCATISEAAQLAWEAGGSSGDSSGAASRHAARRQRLLDEVRDALDRLDQRVRSLREQEERATAAEELRLKGEAIYASIASLRRGQQRFTTDDGLEVELDPTLSPSENAQEYFERYRKARSAEENLPALIEAALQERAYVDQVRLTVEQAEGYDDIESARLEWVAYASESPGVARASQPKGARPSQAARRPRTLRLPGGQVALLGRTGRQNETVTFEMANPDDLWMHARDMPGAHVILRSGGNVDDAAIETAASLAAWHSDGRGSTSVPVDVTERRHVRKIRGAGPGMVTYRNERTINVRPRSEEELGIVTTGRS